MLEIDLNKYFQPREWQKKLFQALRDGYKKILLIIPRRAGKDVASFCALVEMALKEPGGYLYLLPTQQQARSVIFNAVLGDGKKFSDFIPPEMLDRINVQTMTYHMKNGSYIMLAGSNNYNRLVGMNFRGVVFSEWARADSQAYAFLRPVLTALNGVAIFNSTPYGLNHLYDMYNFVKDSPEWYTLHLTVEDTKHIPLETIQKEIDDNLMSIEMVSQEYYCKFLNSQIGCYYAAYMDKMRFEERITPLIYDPAYPVHSAWDLGVRDQTIIIQFQLINNKIYILDCYDKNKEGLEHYINYIKSRPYVWGKHIAPHDINVTEFTSGLTRIQKAHQLGLDFTVADKVSIADGIEAVRTILPRTYINDKCIALIRAIDSYRQEYDHERKVFSPHPRHDLSSHFNDALRYLAISLPKLQAGKSAEELESAYRKARYGVNMYTGFFREDM